MRLYNTMSRSIEEFVPIARAIVALKNLKVISFGPRPQDFLACNAPIKRLYDLGIEIEENSELDLFEAFKKHEGDPRIEEVAKDRSYTNQIDYSLFTLQLGEETSQTINKK